ncbi:MAG: tetratricopeptide repeat protein [Planctomycetota bacterium]|nr:tetratricopeptide repeat protein [Planctomycetota bacterium]
MNVRKEQVLLILVVLLAAYCSSEKFGGVAPMPVRYSPTALEFEPAAFTQAALVDSEPDAIVRRDFFTEPSETRPLPPRELQFPPRAPLSVCGLPLDPGPDFRHSWLLRLDGAAVAGVTIARGVDVAAGGEEDVADGGQDVGVGPMSEEQAQRLYDRLYIQGLSKPFYGVLDSAQGADPFDLEQRTDFSGFKLRFRVFSLRKRTLGRAQPFGDAPGLQKIARFAVADTLRNEVTRRVRAVPTGDASRQGDRLALIEWLLEQAQTESWIYEEALKQSEDYLQSSGQTLGGRRVMQRVLRAMGSLSEEVKLLEGTSGDNEAAAFREMGLGVVKARLGLWVEAEQQLARAAELAPTDARTHGTLAEFYRSRGRTVPALAAAMRARQTLGSVQDPSERGRIVRTILGCMLAVGDLDAARELAPTGSGDSYLRGCVAYAGGDIVAAKAAFEGAATSRDAGAARLGRAACMLQAGEWQEAYALLTQIADEDPLLRHRAWTGVALLFSRIGSYEDALTYCDRALEASPGDAYALYLKGRTLRLMGQYGDAREALSLCLRVHDDFLHAVAEMSAVQSGLGDNAVGTDQAAAWLSARRYLDRAVALAPKPELELLELQGLRAFQTADRRAARAAFEAARDLVENDADRGYSKGALAVVAYSLNRVDDAVTTLERVERDLGRDSELGKWAGSTLGKIEVHAQKEALGDTFDRDKLGALWSCDADKGLGAKIRDGKLVFRGKFSSSGSGEVFAERNDAIARGKNFLATSVEMAVLPGTELSESWNGLGIEIHRGRQGVDMSARVGVYQGQPMVTVRDGRESDDNAAVRKKLSPALMRDSGAQQLELRVVPNGADDARQMILQVYFNNALVHSQQLKLLTRSTNTALKTIVFTSGNKRASTDVAFDNYQLERRKEAR